MGKIIKNIDKGIEGGKAKANALLPSLTLNEWLEIYGPEIIELVIEMEDNAAARGTLPYGYGAKLRTKSRKNWDKLVKLLGRENF